MLNSLKETKRIAVLIPLYRNVLDSYEQISLAQCKKILNRYDLIFVSPEDLDITEIQEEYGVANVERFAKEYFQSTCTYSRLMLSKEFYRRFQRYEFILIYQLDAFVFADQLMDWCAKGQDYVGAPWIGEDWPKTIMPMAKKPLWARIFLFKMLFFKKDNFVGNGGLSLRKVSSALKVLGVLGGYASNWLTNEDVFWSIYVPNVLPFFKVPDMRDAARFSLEQCPREGLEMNGGLLPFGCHAWEKWDIDCWRPHIERRGYSLEINTVGSEKSPTEVMPGPNDRQLV